MAVVNVYFVAYTTKLDLHMVLDLKCFSLVGMTISKIYTLILPTTIAWNGSQSDCQILKIAWLQELKLNLVKGQDARFTDSEGTYFLQNNL